MPSCLEIEEPQSMPVLILYVQLGVHCRVSVSITQLGLCSAFQLRLKIGKTVFLGGRHQSRRGEVLPYLGHEGSGFPYEGFETLSVLLEAFRGPMVGAQ